MSAAVSGPSEGRLVSNRIVFRGRAFKVRAATISKQSGKLSTREIVDHSDSVAIVAIDEEGNALLVRQYRDSVEKALLEIPAGGIEPGETADDCVRRELREETGYLPRNIKKVGGFYSAPGFCTEYLHLYLATNLERSPLRAEDTEEISLVRVPLAEARQLVSLGQIEDAKSIAGLLTVITFYQGTVAI